METQVCPLPSSRPRHILRASSLPLPPKSEFPLHTDSDAVWACANTLRATQQRSLVEPEHLALALLYGQINDIDEAHNHPGPILDVPLLWTCILKVSGNPKKFGEQLRESVARPYDEPQTIAPSAAPSNWTSWDILETSSQRTLAVLRGAKDSRAMFGDNYIAPHHFILALLKDDQIRRALFTDQDISERKLIDTVEGFRGPKVKFQWSPPRFEMLTRFGIDLTELAKDKKIGPVIGRDHEIRRLICVLSRRTKNSAVLLGDPGVGKTAIAEGLALRIVDREVPACLNARIFSLDMASLLAGTTCHGMYEARVEAVLNEVERSEQTGHNVIIYIDEIHLIMTGRLTGGSGGLDAGNLMKPFLARGKLRCFGSTTSTDFLQSIEQDQSLTRRFSQIMVCEPTVAQSITILRGLRDGYQKHHGIDIKDSALVQATKLAHRYYRQKRLPDSAIDLLDESCSTLRVTKESKPEAIAHLEGKLFELEVDIKSLEREFDGPSLKLLEEARNRQKMLEGELKTKQTQYSEVKLRRSRIEKIKDKILVNERKEAHLREVGYVRQAEKISGEIKTLEISLKNLLDKPVDEFIAPSHVCPRTIAEVVHRTTNIPMACLLTREKTPYVLKVSDYLSSIVIGQPEAIEAVTSAVHTSQSGLVDPNRPIASFMFTGCSGTGKTLLARTLAEYLFCSKDAIIVINGSEYAQSISLSRLTGTARCSPDSHGGELTECVKRRPFSVVLIDEVDKACTEFHMKLLGMLDEGCLADGDNRVVDFRNCIFIMTSNVGAEHIVEDGPIDPFTRELIKKDMKQHFSPEFLSRIDETIIFRRLSAQEVRRIVDLRLMEVERNQLAHHQLILELDEPSKKFLQTAGYDPSVGARRLHRLIQAEIINPLSDFLLDERIREGEAVRVRYNQSQDRLYLLPNHGSACYNDLD